MALTISDSGIAIRGKQRIAVYNALKQPATGRRILDQARQNAPSMTYQDLRHILRRFEKEEIAACLNPGCQTGRFYVLAGHEDAAIRTPEMIELCAKVARAKTRLAVLKEVAKERFFESHPLTATQIKRYLREHHPLALNHVLGALVFLEGHGLVETVGYTDKRELRIYRITDFGKTILGQVS